MKTIQRYLLDANATNRIKIPFGAEILGIGKHKGKICLWALVNKNNPDVSATFYVLGTGQPCEGLWADDYIGSVTLPGSMATVHVFEKKVLNL